MRFLAVRQTNHLIPWSINVKCGKSVNTNLACFNNSYACACENEGGHTGIFILG